MVPSRSVLLIRRFVAAAVLAAVAAMAAAPAGAQALEAKTRGRARTYEPMLAAAALKYGVDPRLLWTVAYLESRFNPGATSPAGAGGLMQLMPDTGVRFGVRPAERYVAERCVDGSARYLRYLLDTLGNDLDLVLAGYNAGEGAVMAFRDGRSIRLRSGRVINPRRIRTGGVPPYAETRNYVRTGRVIFASLGDHAVFSRDLLARTRQVVVPRDGHVAATSPAAAAQAPAASRSRYYSDVAVAARVSGTSRYYVDDGAPPPRAIELPSDDEVRRDLEAEFSVRSPAPAPERARGRQKSYYY